MWLDEPAAALGSESEKLAMEALNDYRTKAEHDTHADQIHVIANGVVAEDSTHEELLSLKRIYAELNRTKDDSQIATSIASKAVS
jgi:ABC-type multidrug transport system fused ATPase/permease subunit